MPNNWIQGLKKLNAGKEDWIVPRKGSKNYNLVMNSKSVNVISDAIKNKKAREEMDKLKTQNLIGSIVSGVMKSATTRTTKQGRPKKN